MTSVRPVRTWLIAICIMIFVMVVLGGVTRLTESGLSIVEWNPVMGALPPLNERAWQAAFDAYRATPEFRTHNFWMTLADFRAIFWLEYAHRLWGRLIGLAFAVPLIWFWARGAVRGALAAQLAGAFVLGAAQGALGWYMVASGLVDRPSVSHYRLAAHLALAVAIYGWLLWIALGLSPARERATAPRAARALAWVMLGWASLAMLWGAFTAGLDAGMTYPTFPLMGGAVLPPGAFEMRPVLVNAVENPALVQFVHRALAISFVLAVFGFWLWSRAFLPASLRIPVAVLALVAFLQACLGVATLLTGVAVAVAALHQAGAMVVFSCAVWCAFALRRSEPRP
jgi:cytochrome c oxidase assembly protein subunit 15